MRYRQSRHWDYFPRFPKSRPRAATGGIKAQTKRGAFGQSWWAKRWIGVLESFDIGARLGRGRSYARNGQVVAVKEVVDTDMMAFFEYDMAAFYLKLGAPPSAPLLKSKPSERRPPAPVRPPDGSI